MSKPGDGGIAPKILLGLLLVALGAVAYGGWQVWRKHEGRKQERALLDAPLKPCEDPRPRLPDAGPVAGLEPSALLFSSKCEWLVVGGRQGAVHVLERRSGRVLAQAKPLTHRVEALLLTPDDAVLFVGGSASGGEVAVLSSPALQPVGTIATAARGPVRLAYDAANKVLLTANQEGMQGWKLTLAPFAVAQDPAFGLKADGMVQSLALSPDLKFIAAGTAAGAVTLWGYDAPTARVLEVANQRLVTPADAVAGLAFSRDGRALVAYLRRQKEVRVLRLPDLAPFPAAAGAVQWEIYREPSKMFARPAAAYAGADRAQLAFEMHAPDTDGFYAAWGGQGGAAAFRGSVAASGNSSGVAFWTAFGPEERAPVLLVKGAR